MIVNPEVDGYQTTPDNDCILLLPAVPKLFRKGLKSELVKIL